MWLFDWCRVQTFTRIRDRVDYTHMTNTISKTRALFQSVVSSNVAFRYFRIQKLTGVFIWSAHVFIGVLIQDSIKFPFWINVNNQLFCQMNLESDILMWRFKPLVNMPDSFRNSDMLKRFKETPTSSRSTGYGLSASFCKSFKVQSCFL